MLKTFTDMVTDMKQEDDDLEVVDPLAENDSDNCSMMIVRKSTNSLADHNRSSLDDDQFDSITEIGMQFKLLKLFDVLMI